MPCPPAALAQGLRGHKSVPAAREEGAMALWQLGALPPHCFGCSCSIAERHLGRVWGCGPARDAGAWQLHPFQLCAQSRNSPGIRGRGTRLGWKNPTASTSQEWRLSHRVGGRRGATGRNGNEEGHRVVGGSLHPSEPDLSDPDQIDKGSWGFCKEFKQT